MPSSLNQFIPLILIAPLLLIPIQRILHRLAINRWWCLLALVPFVNLIALWVLAYSRWPSANQNG